MRRFLLFTSLLSLSFLSLSLNFFYVFFFLFFLFFIILLFSTVIKTLKGYEAIFLRKVLPQYLEHLEQYPDSLLCRFYDVVTLNEPSTGAQAFGKKIRSFFFVLSSFFLLLRSFFFVLSSFFLLLLLLLTLCSSFSFSCSSFPFFLLSRC